MPPATTAAEMPPHHPMQQTPPQDSARPRRSFLYVPGDRPRALEKARELPTDGLILDLEDAVPPEAKVAARAAIAEALAQGGYGAREKLLRVNALDTEWGRADLAAAAAMPLNGVALPKVESAETVRTAAALLAEAGAPGLPIWCLIETSRGVLKALDIAEAHGTVAGLILGTSDLAKDLHLRPDLDPDFGRSRAALLPSLGQVLLAARAAGIVALDGVHLDLDDDEGFEAACRQGAAMGFDGKTLIHPKTIATANRLFGPSPAAIDRARRVVAAYGEAAAAGRGVVLLDGRLVEALHVAEARRLLALAEEIERRQA